MGGAFVGGLEEIHLHFLSQSRKKIKVSLRLAAASGAHSRRISLFESPLRKYHTNKKHHPYRVAFFIGGLEEIRTPDPHNANVVRSQLRYKPKVIGRL